MYHDRDDEEETPAVYPRSLLSILCSTSSIDQAGNRGDDLSRCADFVGTKA